MARSIPESDWKCFRELHRIAVARYCQQVLDEINQIAADPKATSHERYLKIYKVIQERDRTMSELFDDMRRSTALTHILMICSRNLITEEEAGRFTQDTRDLISRFAT